MSGTKKSYPSHLRLGVNIDHVATIRNARGGRHPDPLRAALAAEEAGADGITAHLREDRRHISDDDIQRLTHDINLPLNFEMAATDEMLVIALNAKPHAVCLVPEKREELTTEGGLNVIGGLTQLAPFVSELSENGSRVSLFIDADPAQIRASADLGAVVVELHTGAYCDAHSEGDMEKADRELSRLKQGAKLAFELGLEVHAGHGLSFETVKPVAAIPELSELNIGHFLIGEAIFGGLDSAIKRMRALMTQAKQEASGIRTA